MKTTILHVEAYDDLQSIRDRISWCKSQRILLILPRRYRDLAERLDLQLIDRAARQQGSQLGIVTKDRLVRNNAKSLGINVFRTISSAEMEYWIDEGLRPIAGGIRGKDVILAEKRQLPVASELMVGTKIFRKYVLITALVFFVLLLLFVFPSAIVVLYPETVNQVVSLEIRASTSTGQSNINGLIPAMKETYTLNASRTGKSSGSVKVGKDKSRGEVRVVNLTGEDFELPVGTIFLTSGSSVQRFITDKEFSIPVDAEGVIIPVEAILAGVDGNVASGEINLVEGVNGSFLEVINENEFTGGSSLTLPAPTAYDYNQLRELILRDLADDIYSMNDPKELSGLLPVVESLELEELVEERMSNPIGEASDTATLEVTARFGMLFYDPAEVSKVATQVLDLSIGSNQRPVGSEIGLTQIGDVQLNSASEATWQVNANRLIVQDYPRREILQLIKGMSRNKATAMLNAEIPHYRSAEVMPFAKWWPYLPILASRIQLVERVTDGG